MSSFSVSSAAPFDSNHIVRGKQLIYHNGQCNPRRSDSSGKIGGFSARACLFNPNSIQQPIIKEALKEPVAFVGGIFAGILRLDLNEDPLKEWVSKTIEASGIREEEVGSSGGFEAEETLGQQIEIE